MKYLIAIAAALIFTTAFAQEKPAQPSPEIRAMSTRIFQEVNASLQCQSYNYAMEDRVKAAEAEVKRLTDKYEPKEPAK